MTKQLDIDFTNAVNNANNKNNNNTSTDITDKNNQTLLFLYSHYKQATIGDCNISKPIFYDIKGNYKYTAWYKLKGMDEKTAKKKYIKKIKALDL
jgi:diazepam-binding inhibitor (GABA receptor modulating acyl-CoA-binding protein)